jgi:hypothetical protein
MVHTVPFQVTVQLGTGRVWYPLGMCQIQPWYCCIAVRCTTIEPLRDLQPISCFTTFFSSTIAECSSDCWKSPKNSPFWFSLVYKITQILEFHYFRFLMVFIYLKSEVNYFSVLSITWITQICRKFLTISDGFWDNNIYIILFLTVCDNSTGIFGQNSPFYGSKIGFV